MSINITNLHNNRGNIISLSGNIGWNEFHTVIADHLNKSPQILKKYKYSIVDYRDVKNLKIVASDVFKIAKHCLTISSNAGNTRIAIIKSNTSYLKFFDIWKSVTRPIGWKVELFDTLLEATEWIESELYESDISFSDQFKVEYCSEEFTTAV